MGNTSQIEDKVMPPANSACNSKKRRKSVMRVVETALLVVGSVLIAFALLAGLEGRFVSQAALRAFDSVPAATVLHADASSPEAASPEPDYRDWDKQRAHAYQKAPSVLRAPIAVLDIPKIHLVAPVFEGTDALTLNHSVGLIEDTARPGERGNVGLAGHRDGFFRGLKDLGLGDAIQLRTRDGKDVYTVDRLQIVSPRDVSVLRPQPKPALTLVTCYPFYYIGSAPKRFVVTAYLTQHSPAGPTTSETRPEPITSSSTREEQ